VRLSRDSAQAQEPEDKQNNDDRTYDPDDSVHCSLPLVVAYAPLYYLHGCRLGALANARRKFPRIPPTVAPALPHVIKVIFALLLPPVGVFLEVGLKGHFWLSILLFVLFAALTRRLLSLLVLLPVLLSVVIAHR
jgi:uncharacterized membrane protein YqaE (UPF0057 family)